MTEQESQMLKRFYIFGFPRRYQIMLALTEKSMSHGELSAMFSAPGIFPHIQRLEELGLITRETFSARDVRYRANPDALEEMSQALSAMAATATMVPA